MQLQLRRWKQSYPVSKRLRIPRHEMHIPWEMDFNAGEMDLKVGEMWMGLLSSRLRQSNPVDLRTLG